MQYNDQLERVAGDFCIEGIADARAIAPRTLAKPCILPVAVAEPFPSEIVGRAGAAATISGGVFLILSKLAAPGFAAAISRSLDAKRGRAAQVVSAAPRREGPARPRRGARPKKPTSAALGPANLVVMGWRRP